MVHFLWCIIMMDAGGCIMMMDASWWLMHHDDGCIMVMDASIIMMHTSSWCIHHHDASIIMMPFGTPRSPSGIPRRSQAAPKGPQESPRHFATKNSKLAEAFGEFWREGPQNSAAAPFFFENAYKPITFWSFCVDARSPAAQHTVRALKLRQNPIVQALFGEFVIIKITKT